MTDPLDKSFGLGSSDTFEDPEPFEIVIPDHPTLDDITKFALLTFKEHAEDAAMVDPKYRARMLEVAVSYLKIAQDSIKERDELVLKERKLDIDEFVAVKRVSPDKGGDKPGSAKTRNEILFEIHEGNKHED